MMTAAFCFARYLLRCIMGSQPRKFLGVQILSRDARQGGDSAGNVEELLEAKMYRMCRNGREKEQI